MPILDLESYEEEQKVAKRKLKKLYPEQWMKFESMQKEFHKTYKTVKKNRPTKDTLVDYFMKNNEDQESEGEGHKYLENQKKFKEEEKEEGRVRKLRWSRISNPVNKEAKKIVNIVSREVEHEKDPEVEKQGPTEPGMRSFPGPKLQLLNDGKSILFLVDGNYMEEEYFNCLATSDDKTSLDAGRWCQNDTYIGQKNTPPKHKVGERNTDPKTPNKFNMEKLARKLSLPNLDGNHDDPLVEKYIAGEDSKDSSHTGYTSRLKTQFWKEMSNIITMTIQNHPQSH
ncbi:hypothetical protein JTB14_030555 [Gonioctena quinquepunctata]|nr:hypothetical protein JTB14_030555 [Gonioctena quinquepunctata]